MCGCHRRRHVREIKADDKIKKMTLSKPFLLIFYIYLGRALPVGTRVLAMYPETSVFYNATIVSIARKSKVRKNSTELFDIRSFSGE